MTTLKAVEAKSHFSEILDRASKGEEFVVTRRGEPVAKLVPITKSKRDRQELLESIRKTRKSIASRGSMLKEGETWNDLAREGLR